MGGRKCICTRRITRFNGIRGDTFNCIILSSSILHMGGAIIPGVWRDSWGVKVWNECATEWIGGSCKCIGNDTSSAEQCNQIIQCSCSLF